MNSLDLSQLKGEADRLSKDFSSNDFLANFVKMPEKKGTVVVRLLGPAASGMFDCQVNPFYQSTRTHKVNGKNLHCLKVLQDGKWEGECPICRYYNWLWKESESKGKEEADQMQVNARKIKPIERYYFNCIVRKEVDSNGVVHENVGPKILSVGKTLYKLIIVNIVGDEELSLPALGDVTDFKAGRDFQIIKTIRQSGEESYPNYDTSRFLDPSPVDPDLAKACMESLHNLAALRHPLEAEEMKIELKKHLGLIPDVEGTNFDPSEFQVPVSGSVNVQSEKNEKETSETTETVEAVVEGAETQDDDDFITKLREIG